MSLKLSVKQCEERVNIEINYLCSEIELSLSNVFQSPNNFESNRKRLFGNIQAILIDLNSITNSVVNPDKYFNKEIKYFHKSLTQLIQEMYSVYSKKNFEVNKSRFEGDIKNFKLRIVKLGQITFESIYSHRHVEQDLENGFSKFMLIEMEHIRGRLAIVIEHLKLFPSDHDIFVNQFIVEINIIGDDILKKLNSIEENEIRKRYSEIVSFVQDKIILICRALAENNDNFDTLISIIGEISRQIQNKSKELEKQID